MTSARARTALKEFEAYLSNTKTWGHTHAAKLHKNPVAYFSAEFGLHESLPIAAGGLGILAGDHTKSASDLGLGFVGIGLFYQKILIGRAGGPASDPAPAGPPASAPSGPGTPASPDAA